MSEREYIVSLKRGVDAASFAAEMTQTRGNSGNLVLFNSRVK